MKYTKASSSLVLIAALAALLAIGCSRSDRSVAASEKPAAAAPSAAGIPAAAVPAAATSATAATPGNATAGEAVYLRVCIVCHQHSGLGLPGAFPPLAESSIVTAADPGRVIRIVLHGLQGPIEVNGMNYNTIMPQPVPPLTDQEIADVLTYVRNEWGNEAPPVSVEAVTAIRTQAQRTTPWTWAELEKI